MVTCKDCKKRLDLNKNRAISDLWNGQRTDKPGDIQNTFRFMRRHWGHCVDLISDENPEYGYQFNYSEEFGK